MRLRCPFIELTLLLVLGLSLQTQAQTPASHEKGLSSNTAYQIGDLDHINLFNGNLVLRLPIGAQYPITPSFSYGLTLTYNSNAWDYDERTCNFQGSLRHYAVPIQDRHTNAGFGWQLQLGRLFFPFQEPFNEASNWLYLSPDGATHLFSPQLHPGHPATPQPRTWFTRDGTYLRLRHYPLGTSNSCAPSSSPSSECLTVEFPDGTIHEFRNFPTTESNWRVTRMKDRFDNYVDVDYLNSPERWRLSDQHGRVQTVTFSGGKVSKVDLSAFGNQAATYSFQYTAKEIERQNYDPATCSTGPDEGLTVTVDTLSRLVLPDGSFYDMSYFGAGTLSGGIDKLRLPTGGAYSWTYQAIDMLSSREPNEFSDYDWSELAYGVATKSLFENATASPIGTWTYDQQSIGNPTAPNDRIVPCYHTMAVTDPLGHQTVNYFASSQQWNHEYALPFTHCDPHAGGPYSSNGPFLSQEVYEGTVADGTKKRSVWVRYGAGGKNVNPAPQLRKVVYHDDGDLFRQVENHDFDGLGRFRRMVESGDFDGTQTRTKEVDYHLETGVLIRTIEGSEAQSSTFSMPSQNTPRVWTTFTEQRVTEGAQASKMQFCFDRATGFLERQRVLAGTSPGSNDLLTVFESETIGARETGQVARELLYGGDGGQLSTSNNLCGFNLPTESYEQQHTYANGALATSAWIDCDGTEIVKTVDQDIDAKSGLVAQSRDSAGVATTFVYDTVGRLTSERAQSGAWTQTDYKLPSASSPNQVPQITVTQCGNGQATCGFNQRLAWQQSVYDGLGRMIEEHVQMPDIAPGSVKTSSRQHVHNELGWKLSETSWGSPGQKTRFENHDRFGRVGAGKLVLAKRYNYVDILPPLPARRTGSIPVVISDTYEYQGRDGRASSHQLRYQLGVTTYLFNTSYTWDEQGNVDRLTYPNCLHDACANRVAPREVDHDYERGFLRKVGTYANFIAYQAGGMLRRVPHGNGVSDWIDLAGDGLARPHRIRTEGVSNGNWNTGNYIYDGAQNISNIGSLSFSYDLLNRLTVGDVDLGNGQIKRQTATYDVYGNIQQLVSGGVAQKPAPNAATNRLATASYDVAGNVVATTLGSVDYAYDFDPLNMMKHLRTPDDVSRIFIYNANDERVLTFDCAADVCATGKARETWSLRGLGGRVLREISHLWGGWWSWTRDVIYRDGQLLAYVEKGGKVRHLHLDHLGTPRQITDQIEKEVWIRFGGRHQCHSPGIGTPTP